MDFLYGLTIIDLCYIFSVVLPQSEDIENTLCNEEDMNDGLLNAGSEGTRRGGVRSTGDMEHEARGTCNKI
jgi:hypothetical protein